jgi:TRAP-type transport system periplasmic protein
MKRKKLMVAMGLFLGIFLLAASAHALNLRFNVMYSPKHPLCKEVFAPWANEVKKVTDGRVKVTMFYSNALFKPKDALDAISSRVGDIGIVLPVYTRSKLILNSVMDQPMVAGENALQNSEALWEMYQSTPDMQKELKDVKVLWSYMNPAFQLHFTKKKVEDLKELQNVVLSAGGATQTQLLRLLGASPEAMPMVQVFLAMQKGVVEGCFLPYAPLRTQKIADLTHFHTNANLMAVSFFVTVNKSAWDKISDKDKKAIEAISGLAAAKKSGQVFDAAQKRDVAWMAQKGDKFFNLSADEKKLWAEKIAPVREKWIADAKAKGYADPQKVLDKAMAVMAEKGK